jgi:hypothetical protein
MSIKRLTVRFHGEGVKTLDVPSGLSPSQIWEILQTWAKAVGASLAAWNEASVMIPRQFYYDQPTGTVQKYPDEKTSRPEH